MYVHKHTWRRISKLLVDSSMDFDSSLVVFAFTTFFRLDFLIPLQLLHDPLVDSFSERCMRLIRFESYHLNSVILRNTALVDRITEKRAPDNHEKQKMLPQDEK